jgi:formamidopyrimidine-DNA glycosylase
MPELPDLQVICEFLAPRLNGRCVAAVEVRRPIVVRNLLGQAVQDLEGSRVLEVRRRGKFLLIFLDEGVSIVMNPMLAGRIRFGTPLARDRTRDALLIRFDGGEELRYHDAKDMGKVYLARDLGLVPTYSGLGPEANDPELSQDLFRQRLRRHRGEIKGILTNQAFVAGIGNAYADEICWRAQIYPFRRRPSLADEEVAALHGAMETVLTEAIATLRTRVGDAIDVEIRDFLAVHGRPGQPCPRCGTAISEVKRSRAATHFCRTCQPGLMVGRRPGT